MYKCYDIAFFNSKNGRTQDKKGQRGEKDEKNKKNRENKRDEKDKGSYCKNKINLVIGENSGFEASIYYHIIY